MIDIHTIQARLDQHTLETSGDVIALRSIRRLRARERRLNDRKNRSPYMTALFEVLPNHEKGEGGCCNWVVKIFGRIEICFERGFQSPIIL